MKAVWANLLFRIAGVVPRGSADAVAECFLALGSESLRMKFIATVSRRYLPEERDALIQLVERAYLDLPSDRLRMGLIAPLVTRSEPMALSAMMKVLSREKNAEILDRVVGFILTLSCKESLVEFFQRNNEARYQHSAGLVRVVRTLDWERHGDLLCEEDVLRSLAGLLGPECLDTPTQNGSVDRRSHEAVAAEVSVVLRSAPKQCLMYLQSLVEQDVLDGAVRNATLEILLEREMPGIAELVQRLLRAQLTQDRSTGNEDQVIRLAEIYLQVLPDSRQELLALLDEIRRPRIYRKLAISLRELGVDVDDVLWDTVMSDHDDTLQLTAAITMLEGPTERFERGEANLCGAIAHSVSVGYEYESRGAAVERWQDILGEEYTSRGAVVRYIVDLCRNQQGLHENLCRVLLMMRSEHLPQGIRLLALQGHIDTSGWCRTGEYLLRLAGREDGPSSADWEMCWSKWFESPERDLNSMALHIQALFQEDDSLVHDLLRLHSKVGDAAKQELSKWLLHAPSPIVEAAVIALLEDFSPEIKVSDVTGIVTGDDKLRGHSIRSALIEWGLENLCRSDDVATGSAERARRAKEVVARVMHGDIDEELRARCKGQFESISRNMDSNSKVKLYELLCCLYMGGEVDALEIAMKDIGHEPSWVLGKYMVICRNHRKKFDTDALRQAIQQSGIESWAIVEALIVIDSTINYVPSRNCGGRAYRYTHNEAKARGVVCRYTSSKGKPWKGVIDEVLVVEYVRVHGDRKLIKELKVRLSEVRDSAEAVSVVSMLEACADEEADQCIYDWSRRNLRNEDASIAMLAAYGMKTTMHVDSDLEGLFSWGCKAMEEASRGTQDLASAAVVRCITSEQDRNLIRERCYKAIKIMDERIQEASVEALGRIVTECEVSDTARLIKENSVDRFSAFALSTVRLGGYWFFDSVIEAVMVHGACGEHEETIKKMCGVFSEAVFGTLAIEHMQRDETVIDFHDGDKHIRLHDYRADSATTWLEKIAEMKGPIADGLLHFAARRENRNFYHADQVSPVTHGTSTLDYSEFRDCAKSALMRRGNPMFNAKVFRERKWFIEGTD